MLPIAPRPTTACVPARRLAIFFVLLCLLAAPLAATVTDGTIAGRVTDVDGAPLPGVTVTLDDPSLPRAARVDQTDADGRFRLTPLPAGRYDVAFTLEGFRTERVAQLAVGVGQSVRIDPRLALADIGPIDAGGDDAIDVVAAAPLLDTARPALTARVTPDQLEALPLNGREVAALVSLAPGVTPRPAAVDGERFSIFAERPAATGYLLDGSDNTDPIDGGPLQRFTQDAVREFEIVTTGYRAEFGRAQGGVVNVVTRRGDDQLRGGGFWTRRDDAWDSSNQDGDPPPLARDQAGLSLGGPLLRERAFFFVSGEWLDEARGRNLDPTAVPTWVLDGLATPGGREPLDAGPTADDRTLLGKTDWLLRPNHQLTFSLLTTDDDAGGEVPAGIAGALVLPSGARSRLEETRSAGLRHTWLAPGDARDLYLEGGLRLAEAERGDNLGDGSGNAARDETVLLLRRSGFLQTGAPVGGRQTRDLDRIQLGHTLSLRLGQRHHLRAGYDWLRSDWRGRDAVWNDVEYSSAFLAPDADIVLADAFERLGFAQSAARFFRLPTLGGDLELDMTNDDVGLFVQDQIQLHPHVTLDVGLRWDHASLFGDDNNNLAPRAGVAWDVGGRGTFVVKASGGVFYDRNALTAAATVPEKGGIFTRSAFDVALPRLGVDYTDSLIDLVITSGFPGGAPENPAYRPFADDLRGDPLHLYRLIGIDVADAAAPPIVTAANVESLSGRTPAEVVALLEAAYPGTAWTFFDVPGGSLVGGAPGAGAVLSFLPRGGLDQSRDVSRYAEDRTPRTESLTIGFDWRINDRWLLSTHLVRRRTRDLLTRRIVNLVDAAPGEPGFGQTVDGGPRINQVTYEGFVDYDGAVLSLRRPLRDGFGLQLSYTYSDAVDNLLTGQIGSGFSDNNDPNRDRGPSNLSVPHVGVVSGIVALPWDMRLAGTFFWRDGLAFSPRGITDQDGDGLVDQRDVSVPRNAFRSDDYVNLDLRLEKRVALTSGHALSLVLDVFNATNEANVANVVSVAGPDFGTPTDFFPGREIQLGVRYTFGGF
ncbi:MAG: TonB-dependent receptor [Acidobacteriota bacterium]